MPEPPVVDAHSLARLSREWDDLAAADPLWAVLSAPDRKGGRWTVEEFLASGESEIRAQLDSALNAYGRPHRHRTALDFGCGAGRLVHALAARFTRVVGVDISKEMIDHARRLTAGRENITFVVNTEPTLPFERGSFDFVYTTLTLQHVPTRELIEAYVKELVRVTSPDGIALLQVPHSTAFAHPLQPLRRTYQLLRRIGIPARALILRTPLQPMRMTPLPRARFEAAVRAVEGEVLGVVTDDPRGFRYAVAGPMSPWGDADKPERLIVASMRARSERTWGGVRDAAGAKEQSPT